MKDKRPVDELSIEELEQLLYRKKRQQRQQRLQRLREQGRVIEVAGRPAPDPLPSSPLLAPPTGALRRYAFESENDGAQDAADATDDLPQDKAADLRWRWVANKLLLAVEIGAVIGLIFLALTAWGATRELNRELAEVQEAQSASVALPTPTATPVIGVVVLPSGHKPPINGQAVPGEAGNIPDHLLPIINSYVPPPIPTPGPEQARRIQIAAINIDKPIVQGDDWEQLKKGVGQHIGSALPGQEGNLVLSAHNDIFGEIFRDLDKLKPGDEVIISTERQSYTYIVREIQVVEPTEVSVMAPTEHASATLISCYPYLVNNKRIVVFADLASTGPLGGPSS
jgi:sortase A